MMQRVPFHLNRQHTPHRQRSRKPSPRCYQARAVCILLSLLLLPNQTVSDPQTRPYIPYRTDPFEHVKDEKNSFDPIPSITRNLLFPHLGATSAEIMDKPPESTIHRLNIKDGEGDARCPLSFHFGISHKSHEAGGIHSPPVVHPVHLSHGPGRQIVYSTDYEHLDLLTPSLPIGSGEELIQEMVEQSESYPLLFESSSFYHTHPIVHDVNGDGIPDAIVTDYDGGIYMVGLDFHPGDGKRFFKRVQVPRLQVRKSWWEVRLNATREEEEKNPYHSYFEYNSDVNVKDKGDAVGVSGNVLGQEAEVSKELEERRQVKKEEAEKFASSSSADVGEKKEKEEAAEGGDKTEGDKTEGAKTSKEDTEQAVEQGDKTEIQQEGKTAEAIKDVQEEAKKSLEQGDASEAAAESEKRRRLQEVPPEEEVVQEDGGEPADTRKEEEEDLNAKVDAEDADPEKWDGEDDARGYDDMMYRGGDDMMYNGGAGGGGGDGNIADDDEYTQQGRKEQHGDDDWDSQRDRYYDDYRGGAYDDYPGRYPRDDDYRIEQSYYDDTNYIRLPPHILSNPVLVQLPKMYSRENEQEELLLFAVSYYLDEDEYEGKITYRRFHNEDGGDDTESERGRYVASALASYKIEDNHWTRQEHLELSTDYTSSQNHSVGTAPILRDTSEMGAFALGSPTVAELKGDGKKKVLVGTSMGIIYAVSVENLLKEGEGWPVQMPYAVEDRVLVEDVVGNTDLEVFAIDVGGNVVSLDASGNTLWHRDMIASLPGFEDRGNSPRGNSPMTMGDVDGDGILDLVFALKVTEGKVLLCAIQATTGNDLENFPILIDRQDSDGARGAKRTTSDRQGRTKLPQPLLVDLHADQSHWTSYIRRNGTKVDSNSMPKNAGSDGNTKDKTKSPPLHGGTAPGLHIVQPVDSRLYIIEGGSGCAQRINVGNTIASMVQVDDVHGTNSLDLIVTTSSGNVLTLESDSVPYHPLNVWNGGDIRSGRVNDFSQGYTASQGIYVHDVSRQYRDILGVYVPVTFEIFDNRPNIQNEPEKRSYLVDIRDGTSLKRAIFRREYNTTGIYTERLYVQYGPGYYAFTVRMQTSHGLIYEDMFHVGYNVHYMDGLGYMLWLPLVVSVFVLGCFGTGKKKGAVNYRDVDGTEDDDGDDEGGSSDGRLGGRGMGILGRA